MNNRLDTAANMFELIVTIHNRLMRPAIHKAKIAISPLQTHALCFIKDNNFATMSMLASEISISKQQLTPMVDTLVSQGFVERGFAKLDRRIIRLSLTESGMQLLDSINEDFRQILSAQLESLDDNELPEMNNAVIILTRLIKKLP